jgi:hypothetical protein
MPISAGLSIDEGRRLVQLARSAIELYLHDGRQLNMPDDAPKSFSQKRGVFVTLNSYPGHELRGCIGLPYATKELGLAAIDAALAAAFEDPRFNEIEDKELSKIIIEISVLTEPERIKVKDSSEYPKKISIGADGLIVKAGPYGGLLLPQVPVEQGWNEEEYLEGICYKAGISPDSLAHASVELYKFQAQIFSEEKPGGDIVEKKLKTY